MRKHAGRVLSQDEIKGVLSQSYVDSLLSGVTGILGEDEATACPRAVSENDSISEDDWAAAMAAQVSSDFRKPPTLEWLIEKLQYDVDRADRDISLILERRNTTQDILEDLLRLQQSLECGPDTA